MRVNRNGIVFYGTRGFGQKHREGDESKRLPKLRNFKPDEQGDEAATRGGEESANGALLTIIPQGSQLGGEIEDGTKNGKTEQTHSHVSIRRSFEMQIDDDGAIEKEHTGVEDEIFFCETQVEEVAEINAKKMQADEQARQQTKTAENDFFGDDSSRQKSLRAHKPEDGHVISGVVERNGGEHQRRANHAQDDECGAAAFRNGQLGKAEFECPNEQESKVSEFRLDGLKLHDAEEQ